MIAFRNGTVAGENVSRIGVTCTVNQYRVGGTVSVLAGSGLVLNNGSEQLTMNANGSFTLPAVQPQSR